MNTGAARCSPKTALAETNRRTRVLLKEACCRRGRVTKTSRYYFVDAPLRGLLN